MAFLCQYILNINCLWKFLSNIVLFIAYLGFLLSRTVSIPIINSQTKFATLTPWCRMILPSTDLHVGLILDQLLCSSVQEPDVRVSLGHRLKTGCYGHRTKNNACAWSMFNTASNEFSRSLHSFTNYGELRRAFSCLKELSH